VNFSTLFKAYDAVVAFRDATRRFKGLSSEPPPETSLSPSAAAQGIAGQIETRLTNVVVAALKEAFDRDHARLELERAQLEEQRPRAEEALRHELRRQAADRELARLRLLGGVALVGWIAAVALFVARLAAMSMASRSLSAAAWLLLLGSLGTAFSAQRRLSTAVSDPSASLEPSTGDAVSLWLLIAGLAVAAVALLF
jgi:LPXTG-motif cell wall-anchored protein